MHISGALSDVYARWIISNRGIRAMSLSESFETQISIQQSHLRGASRIHIPLSPYYYGLETSKEDIACAELKAEACLKLYTEELAKRFKDGGEYDTYKIISGETFVEIVCGGYYNGFLPVHCYEPLTAVQLFIDAIERYFATNRGGKVLHWRTRPEWKSHTLDAIEQWHNEHGRHERYQTLRLVYNIYARLVLV